ncbi:MAG: SdrD B-like domain-containing protein, partial [Bacteroidota bacterium]
MVNISRLILERQLSMFGHVARLPEGDLVHRILVCADPSEGHVGKNTVDNTYFLPSEPVKVGISVEDLQPGVYGDRVWEDTNNNGLQDSGEPGYDGARIELYKDNGDAVADPAVDTLISFTVSANGGYYLFPSLETADYFAVLYKPLPLDLALPNQGTDDALDSDVTVTSYNGFPVGITPITNINDTEYDYSWDMGIAPSGLAAVGGYVWDDSNLDGLQNEAATQGLNNLKIRLYNNAAPTVVLDSMLTANDVNGNPGYYFFDALAVGDYFLEIDLPTGLSLSTLGVQGSSDTGDSDFSSATNRTEVISLSANAYDNSWDAAIILPAGEICGNGFDDDGDGDTDCDDDECAVNRLFSTERYICVDSTITVVADVINGSHTYSWNFGTNAVPATATGPGPHTVSYTAATNTQISMTVTNGACSDSDTDGITVFDCSYSNVAGWDFDCASDTCVSITGIGIKNNLSDTLYIANPSSLHKVLLEATFRGGSGSPDFVRFKNANGDSTDVYYQTFDGDNDRYFQAELPPAAYYSIELPANGSENRAETFVAYLYEQCDNQISMGTFVHESFNRDTVHFDYTIPTATINRDVEIVIPVSELINDPSRIIKIVAEAGGVRDSVILDGYNLGNSLNITPLTLQQVPGTATQIEVDVISPTTGGQSAYLSGAGSINLVCPDLYLVKTADRSLASLGETIEYTYEVYNSGAETVNSINLVDDKLGAIALPVSSLAAGDSTSVKINYTVQSSDLPGPIINIADLSGVGQLTGNTVGWSDSVSVDLMGLSISKIADKTIAYAGDTVNYTYQLSNTGGVP